MSTLDLQSCTRLFVRNYAAQIGIAVALGLGLTWMNFDWFLSFSLDFIIFVCLMCMPIIAVAVVIGFHEGMQRHYYAKHYGLDAKGSPPSKSTAAPKPIRYYFISVVSLVVSMIGLGAVILADRNKSLAAGVFILAAVLSLSATSYVSKRIQSLMANIKSHRMPE